MKYVQVKDSKDGIQVVTNKVIKLIDGDIEKIVPNDQANRDWVKYQEWLAAGNTPDPAD